ncbi:MAG: hypothetical protein CL785_05680 [Chloroflexi bacterium]|nr:hypothetical protein [Chloroflexota bacterium]
MKEAVIFPLFSVAITALLISLVGVTLVNIGNEGAVAFGFAVVFIIALIATIFKFTTKALKVNK